jgi:hypothetical protein
VPRRARGLFNVKEEDPSVTHILPIAKVFVAAGVVFAASIPQALQAAEISAAAAPLLARHYREGETVFYRMTASNRDRFKTITYRADATGAVKKDAQGKFIEEFTWSNIAFDGKPVDLTAAKEFRQPLSLSPGYAMTVPDLRPVLKIVGPITDLLTFYVDASLAQNGALAREGDHFRFEHGTPASWADGAYVLLGQDSIDFDVTLKQLNAADGVATVLVRHVVPAQPQIRIPVEWMRTPVADTPNNWVEVQKLQDGSYRAQIGKETFDATIRISLVDGRILGASLVNPVTVSERVCTDEALTKCGDAIRSEIMRKIEIGTER